MSASWTDVVSPNPFVVVAAGRAPFRLDDLMTVVQHIAERQVPRVDGVKEIMPHS